MELFIATAKDSDGNRRPAARDRRSAERVRFVGCKDVLARWPDELQRYYVLSDERKRGRARAWLAAEGYRPAT